jgi:transposase InsO family protein
MNELEQTLDPAEAVRHEAINRFLRGERPTTIARSLGRSRSWFYQVLERYRQAGRDGLRTQSRAPHHVHNRTSEEVEAVIVRIRKTIESGHDPELRYANLGAESIASEVRRLDLTPPHPVTIYRILKRHDLVQPRQHYGREPRLPEDYPYPLVIEPNAVHQADFVRRTLTGGQRFYGAHLLDLARCWPVLRVLTTKSAAAVCQFFVTVWQEVGLPAALQIDNDVVWNGGGRGQRVLSTVVRLCLAVGVQVIFTPPYTPQANGAIESFNDLWDSNFWHRTQFESLKHVCDELTLFETYCRQRRPLPQFEQRTAVQLFPDFQPHLLPATFTRHQQARLPITAGYVHFIRFVSGEGTFSVLNEIWSLDAERWAGKTIRATIDTQEQVLCVYHHPPKAEACQLIQQFEYTLADTAAPLDSAFVYSRPKLWPPVKEP